MSSKRVLVVGVETEALSDVSAHLGAEYAVETTPTPKSALAVLTEVAFDLVVLAHPRGDLVIRDLLDALRNGASSSRRAKVLVLTTQPEHPELQDLREPALEVLSRDDSLIADLATRVLGGDPRVRVSVMVRLEADLPYGTSIRICQSENLSVSGMLVRTEDTFPVGTPVETRFRIPDDDGEIVARARVVRMTGPGEIPGIALRFENLRDKEKDRLQDFLSETDT